jgi:hypothetical protein
MNFLLGRKVQAIHQLVCYQLGPILTVIRRIISREAVFFGNFFKECKSLGLVKSKKGFLVQFGTVI